MMTRLLLKKASLQRFKRKSTAKTSSSSSVSQRNAKTETRLQSSEVAEKKEYPLRLDLQFFAGKGTGNASKIPWGRWDDYPKVTATGREYAKVGDRSYTRHAVERMQPSGMRYSSESAGGKVGASRILEAGQKDYGRSISPNFVEDVINNGKLIDSPIVNRVQRQVWESGSVEVVTEGNIVITIMTK